MGVKVKGVKQSIDRLNEIINDVVNRKAVRAIQASIIIGGTQAALYTPIDTSTLINSQFREVIVNGTKYTGRVGYSADYAAYVADPNIKMKFRRSTAKKDFLNKGFEDTARIRDEVVRKEMSL
ncbi:HK97 gp10 family phage protein [Orbus mooreae]|uniref:HK97 gp10 family phage protein n=1 Tax=Orbus mooreae TaxID=3074107 RepID=UPI00370CFF2A